MGAGASRRAGYSILDWLKRDHVAKTDVDLDGQSRPGDGCAGSDAHTGIFVWNGVQK